MTGQSGFMDSFLKFLEGDESGPMNKPATTRRPHITTKKEETKPPGKVKRPPGRPRKNPKFMDKNEEEKLNCVSEYNFLKNANDLEAMDSVDSDSQNMNKGKMEVLRENFNKCSNEKVEYEETIGEGNVIEIKDVEHVNEDEKQNGESITKEDLEYKAEENKVHFASNSELMETHGNETNIFCEKQISNFAENCEKTICSSASESAADKCGERGKKRRKKTHMQEQGGELPRRELSARKAKRKAKFSYIESESEDNPEFDEGSNSDNDPVWTPNEKKSSSDEEDNFEWKQRQTLLIKPKKVSPGSAKYHHKQNLDKLVNDAKYGSELKRNEGIISRKVHTVSRKDDDVLNQSVVPFQSGSFIALKEELEDLEEPTLWRVDGKALLQKYEPFRSEDGALKYRNVSTYSGWGPKNRNLYQPVPVRFLYQNRFEYIVEIIKEELIINEDKLREKLRKDLEKHSFAYEVYLQTLVSQALDSNFLNEILTEKDDYFLTSLDKMDSLCEEKRKKLLQVFEWSDQLKESLTKWPTLLSTPKSNDDPVASCQVCCKNSYYYTIDLDGEPYSSQTLEITVPVSDCEDFKTFLACKTCLENIQLYNQIAHLKYQTYKECTELVQKKAACAESIDNTKILHDILADGPFIAKKFHDVTLLWAEADLKSRKKKTEDIKIS